MKTNKLGILLRKRLPTILTVTSVLSSAAALYFTGRATVKAVREYDAMKKEGVEITPKIMVKRFLPYYIPAIGFAVTSIGTNIASDTVHVKRNRILSLAATSAVESLRDFKDKSLDILGEDKIKKIETEQAKESPLLSSGVSLTDPIRVYDVETGVKIETTYKTLYEAESEVNAQLSESGWVKGRVNLKTFYKLLGIEEKRLANLVCCNQLWDKFFMYDEWETNWVTFIHEEVYDKDGTLMVMLRYSPDPEYEFVIDERYKESI